MHGVLQPWLSKAGPPILRPAVVYRSTPPRIAAVCVIGKEIIFADMEPDEQVLMQFRARGDNQIASLEMLAIAMGTSFGNVTTLQAVRAFAISMQDFRPLQSNCGAATW